MAYNINDVIAELKALAVATPKAPPLPNDALLDKYEEEVGFSFPDDYRTFLKEASNLFVGTLEPLIVTDTRSARGELSVALTKARRVGLPQDLLPICEDNGDYYSFAPDQSIRLWDHNGLSGEKWQNLATWIHEVWIKGHCTLLTSTPSTKI